MQVFSEDPLNYLITEDLTDSELVDMVNPPNPSEADVRPDPPAHVTPNPSVF